MGGVIDNVLIGSVFYRYMHVCLYNIHVTVYAYVHKHINVYMTYYYMCLRNVPAYVYVYVYVRTYIHRCIRICISMTILVP